MQKKIFPLKQTAFTLLAALAIQNAAQACSVCFSDPKSQEAKGIVWGVVVLLAFITSVLTGIASVIFTWRNRARKLSTHQEDSLRGSQL